MGNIRLYTVIFGGIFLYRLLVFGPWIAEPLFSPFQIQCFSFVLHEDVSLLLQRDASLLAQKTQPYRWILWGMEIVIDGLGWLGMIGLSLRRDFLKQLFWQVWVWIFAFWQLWCVGWFGFQIADAVLWFVLSVSGPYLLWMYGWKRQWLGREA